MFAMLITSESEPMYSKTLANEIIEGIETTRHEQPSLTLTEMDITELEDI